MKFKSAAYLSVRVSIYFSRIKGKFHLENLPGAEKPATIKKQVIWDKPPQPPTLTGLAFFLGFPSIADFEQYETTGEFGAVLKRARLRVTVEYEKRLHQPSPTGAIFALKTLGWNDHGHPADNDQSSKTFTINMVDTGVPIACNEKDVKL